MFQGFGLGPGSHVLSWYSMADLEIVERVLQGMRRSLERKLAIEDNQYINIYEVVRNLLPAEFDGNRHGLRYVHDWMVPGVGFNEHYSLADVQVLQKIVRRIC